MNLLKAERLQVHEELLMYQARRTIIDDERLCVVCRRTIRRSAFACYPNGIVVHVACFKDASTCPCTNPACPLQHTSTEAVFDDGAMSGVKTMKVND